MRLVFAHGWGFDADFWTPLRNGLGIQDTFAVNLGFREDLRERIPFPTMPYVAVGHSLGLLWLLHHYADHPWRALISINGFPRLTKIKGYPNGIDTRILKSMISEFTKDADNTYRDFMTLCGNAKPSTKNLNHDRLLQGLKNLADWDERSVLASLDIPVLALAGDEDQIVPPAMSNFAFKDHQLKIKSGGGHLLPQTDGEWCAKTIKKFLAEAL